MKTDRELLESAAKAAGLHVDMRSTIPDYLWVREIKRHGPYRAWNPLTDDGDALRLAVQLSLPLSFVSRDVWGAKEPAVLCGQKWNENDSQYVPFREAHSGDPYAATRRAIVRAAAELAPPPVGAA